MPFSLENSAESGASPVGFAVSSTGGFVVSTTFWSRPDKRCQTNQPIANNARTGNHGKIEGGVAVVGGAALAPEATSSRIPVSLRYLEKPEGSASAILLFCEVRRLARPAASRPLSRWC